MAIGVASMWLLCRVLVDARCAYIFILLDVVHNFYYVVAH